MVTETKECFLNGNVICTPEKQSKHFRVFGIYSPCKCEGFADITLGSIITNNNAKYDTKSDDKMVFLSPAGGRY